MDSDSRSAMRGTRLIQNATAGAASHSAMKGAAIHAVAPWFAATTAAADVRASPPASLR